MKEENRLKRLVIKGCIIFLGVMFLLTIISKTIYMLLLPEVTTDKARKGEIETQIVTDGKIGYDQLMLNKMQVLVKSSAQGEITKSYVKEGQVVKRGEPLFNIACEVDESKIAQEQMQSNEIELNKNSYERAKADYQKQHQELEDKLHQEQQKLANPEKNYEIIDTEKQIEIKKKELEVNERLLELGSVAKSECDKIKNEIELLEQKRESLMSEVKQKTQDKMDEIKTKLEDIDRQILEQDEKIQLEENKLSGITKEKSQVVISSPIDGVVYEVKVATGVRITEGEELMVIVPNHIPITLSFNLSGNDVDKVPIDKELEWTYNQEKQEAKVIKKTYDKEKDATIITCQIDPAIVENLIPDYKTYKNVDVTITDRSETYDVLVPTSAIKEENRQEYIYYIEEVETIFEKKYIAHKTSIQVIEKGDLNCAVKGISSGEMIVATTNKELEDYSEVKLK